MNKQRWAIPALLILALLLVIATVCRVVPVHADQSQSFVWVADTRGDANNDLISTSILTPIVDNILAMSVKPKVVIFGGDAAYRGGYDTGVSNLPKFREVFTDRLLAKGIPSVFAIGNHELYTMSHAPNLWDQALSRQQEFQTYFNSTDLLTIQKQNGPAGLTNLAFSFHIGNSLFIIPDSYLATANGVEPHYGINAAQQTWMKGLMANNTAAHTFVLTHVPAWSSGNTSPNGNMANTWTTITTSGSANNTNASILFAGHEHLYFRTMHDGTYEVLAGTGGAPSGCEEGESCNLTLMYPGDVLALRYNYAVTSINGREITVSVFDQNNSSVDMFYFFDYSGANNTTITNAIAIAPDAALQQPTGILAGSNNIIKNSASISNVFTGIDAIHNNTITNSASITPLSGGNGILVYDNNTITNTATGSITGNSAGLWGIRVNSGNTVVNQGTVSVSGENSIAFLAQGDNNTITNSGILSASGTNAYAAKFLGAGNSLINSGTISGNVSFSSGNCTFTNNGTFTTADTFVNNGTLMGTGTTIGNIVNNGTVAPGNSIGTMNITGNYTHNAGATLRVEADADGQSDKLAVSGTATINGGTLSANDAGNFLLKANYIYTVLTAGSVVGTFGNVTSNHAFLTPSLSYDPTHVYLLINRNPVKFSDVAATANQYSVASSLERVESSAQGDMLTVINNLLNLSARGARGAYNQMGGLSHATMTEATFSSFNSYANTLSGRLEGFSTGGTSLADSGNILLAFREDTGSDAGNTILAAIRSTKGEEVKEGKKDDASPWGLWSRGYGNMGERKGDDISSKYDYRSGGLVIGFDRKVSERFLLGVSTGYSYAKINMNDLYDNGNVAGYHGSLYGAYDIDPWYVNGLIAYGYNRYDTTRNIAFGNLIRTAHASYGGHSLSGYAETGYRLLLNTINVIPMASLQAGYLFRSAFKETDAGALNLDMDSSRTSSLISSLGVKLRKEYKMQNSSVTPEIKVRWLHEYDNSEYTVNASFADYPVSSFSVKGDRALRDSAAVGFGLGWEIGKNFGLALAYDANLSGDRTEHSVTMGMRYTW